MCVKKISRLVWVCFGLMLVGSLGAQHAKQYYKADLDAALILHASHPDSAKTLCLKAWERAKDHNDAWGMGITKSGLACFA